MSIKYGNQYNDNIIIENKELEIPPLGFQNTGAICYFNALIQCLLSSKNFLRFIIHDNQNPIFLDFFKAIIEDKWNILFTTKLLHECDMIRPNQSSSEYFIFLIDFLKFEPIFECLHTLTIVCKNCGHTKEKEDRSYNVLVNQSIQEFFECSEEIENFNCENCKTKTTITQKKVITALPPVIVFSLNKYFGKHLLDYPKFFKYQDTAYILVGTVEHSGMLGGGHYVSRIFRDNKYYNANDQYVASIAELVPVADTYMLFYERIQ